MTNQLREVVADALPELPTPAKTVRVDKWAVSHYYTANQMREYAQEAIAAALRTPASDGDGGRVDDSWRLELRAKLADLQSDTPLTPQEARADAARLEWLAQEWEKNGTVHFSSERPRQPEVCGLFTCTTQHIKARGFRAAIDAAMNIQPGSPR